LRCAKPLGHKADIGGLTEDGVVFVSRDDAGENQTHQRDEDGV